LVTTTMHPAKHQRRPTAMKSNSGNGEALCSTTNVRPVQSYCSVHQPRSSPVSPSTRLLLPVMLVASAVLLHHGQVVAANGSTAQPETTTMTQKAAISMCSEMACSMNLPQSRTGLSGSNQHQPLMQNS
jgi:hypothetical protein